MCVCVGGGANDPLYHTHHVLLMTFLRPPPHAVVCDQDVVSLRSCEGHCHHVGRPPALSDNLGLTFLQGLGVRVKLIGGVSDHSIGPTSGHYIVLFLVYLPLFPSVCICIPICQICIKSR